MAKSRIHHVEITHASEGKDLIVTWDGFKGRHSYLLASDIDDLDCLITEVSQAVYNYKQKHIIFKHVAKKHEV
jgi:hypothetical protein